MAIRQCRAVPPARSTGAVRVLHMLDRALGPAQSFGGERALVIEPLRDLPVVESLVAVEQFLDPPRQLAVGAIHRAIDDVLINSAAHPLDADSCRPPGKV